MPVRSCIVTFTGPSAISHSIEVVGGSLYEAAVLGLNALKTDGWVETVAPGTTLTVQVRVKQQQVEGLVAKRRHRRYEAGLQSRA